MDMKQSIPKFLGALTLYLATAGCAPQTITLQAPEAEGLSVTGQGEATGAPDLATVRIGVEERALGPEDAMQHANQTMQRIMEAVKAQGVQPKDLQTTDLNMHFERARDSEPIPMPEPAVSAASSSSREQEPRAREKEMVSQAQALKPKEPRTPETSRLQVQGNYVVRNNVVISLRELDKVAEVIGAAMTAGANQMYGFELSIEDPAPLKDRARERAVAAALHKARLLAARAGVELGAIVAIRDTQESPPMPFSATRVSMEHADASMPFERGQLSVTQSVEVTFALGGATSAGAAGK
jgi:hypothetical protein